VNPEPFLKLDRVIHEKGRMAIMSLLAATPELSFTEMKQTLGMTDGQRPQSLFQLYRPA
jgi:hypothetical protein